MRNLAFLLLLFVSIHGFTQLPPKQAYPYDIRQIHSGHSLTDPLFGQPWPGQYVNLMTDVRGVWAGDDIGKSTIPGSPIFWRWDHDSTISPSARFDIADWELQIITEGIPIPGAQSSPVDLTDSYTYLSLYVNNAWQNGNMGNGTPTLLWTTWTSLDGTEGPWRPTLDEYEAYWEELMDYANANRPAGATPVYIIPGHRMMRRIYDDIQLGQVPDITSIDELFGDNIHTNSLGDYAIAMIHYACIYNESPVGLPAQLMTNPPQGFQYPSPSLAHYIQTIVWEEVTNYDRTGITDSTSSVAEKENTSFLIHPNPASTVLHLSNVTDSDMNYSIYDYLGNTIQSGIGPEIDVSQLETGMYFIQVGESYEVFQKL